MYKIKIILMSRKLVQGNWDAGSKEYAGEQVGDYGR